MRTVLTVLLVLFTTRSLAHAEDRPSGTKILSPYFFVEGTTQADSFPLKSTKVTADISGVIANVTVTQIYENHGPVPIHGKYVFPGSTRSAVHGMRIRVGDNAVVARIREREKAAQEFAEAKAAGKSASLLEQQRPNVFSMSVANIMPGDHVEVELRYSEMLVPEQGIYEFVYPTVVGPRYSNIPEDAAAETDKWVQNPYLRAGTPSPATVSFNVHVSAGIPLADLRTPAHQSRVDWENPSLAHIVVDNDPGTRDFVVDYRLSGRQIQSGLLLFEGADENFFLLTVQPPERITAGQIPPREYIFVLDVSGSMHGFPLNTAKRVIQDLVQNLKPTDTFNVLLFSGGSHLMAPVSVAATPENVGRALAVIDGLGAGGGTELGAALNRAIRLPRSGMESRSIVVVTDGYIAAETDVFDLIRANLNTTNFFAFGIGSSVNRYLIEGIARAGQGEPFVVMGPQDSKAAGDRFRSYIQSPVLTQVRVNYSGFDVYDVEPEAQPDLFAERPLVLFGKWRGSKEGRIEVTGRTVNGNFSKVFDVVDEVSRAEHAALPQLWARSRIARLSDFGAENEETVREVTALGLTYSLLTRYTSFIAVLEKVRNPGGAATDVDQPLPLPDGVSELAVGQYGMGAEPGFWMVLLGAVLALLVLAHRRRFA